MSITAADVADTVRLTIATLSEARDADWDATAGPLAWTCWETVEHIADGTLQDERSVCVAVGVLGLQGGAGDIGCGHRHG